MKKKAIIIGNGDIPKKRQILALSKFGFYDIVCADGGANNLYKLKLNPQYIIGDLDSVKLNVLDYFKSKDCRIIKISDQDNTDIEKALDFLLSLGYNDVILFGATGNRIDHTIGNISNLIKYRDKLNLHIIHHNSVLSCYHGLLNFKAKRGEVISFYGLDIETKFTTYGLKYNLNDELLYIGYRESTSNEANDENVSIISNKVFLFVRDFNIACKYGYFY